MTSFGGFLKEKRLKTGLSLREFSRRIGMQASNYCNVENDILSPPPEDTLERIAGVLGLKPGTTDYAGFFDLAAKKRNAVPADIERIIKQNKMIPVMLRTVENEKVTESQLRGIIEDLKSGRYKKAKPRS
jgi:transcriptional regulator with XRE-family HTH domain